VVIDTIADWQTINRLDLNALNHKILQTQYKLVSVNNCGIIGDTSRIISSIYVGDTISNPSFLDVADTVINIIQTDTLNAQFLVSSIETKDSMFYHFRALYWILVI